MREKTRSCNGGRRKRKKYEKTKSKTDVPSDRQHSSKLVEDSIVFRNLKFFLSSLLRWTSKSSLSLSGLRLLFALSLFVTLWSELVLEPWQRIQEARGWLPPYGERLQENFYIWNVLREWVCHSSVNNQVLTSCTRSKEALFTRVSTLEIQYSDWPFCILIEKRDVTGRANLVIDWFRDKRNLAKNGVKNRLFDNKTKELVRYQPAENCQRIVPQNKRWWWSFNWDYKTWA